MPDLYPKVFIAVLARDKEATLSLFLKCIENLDYPKDRLVLYIRTNNNSDKTKEILKEFIDRTPIIRINKGIDRPYDDHYLDIIYDDNDEDPIINDHTHHDWNGKRFKVLGDIRNKSLQKSKKFVDWQGNIGCDFYFVVDCDNFIKPNTLKNLVYYGLPIVAPLLYNDQHTYYSNYHYDIDDNGYLKDHPFYKFIFDRQIVGLIQVKVVHCTYLIRSDVIDELGPSPYDDGSGRYEYVIFSDTARKKNIPQYIDNIQDYGIITFKTKPEEMIGFEEKFMKNW